MSHKTAFLGKDPIFPLLLKMGIPAAVGMLVNALYNIVDTIFVGQGVGPLAIAALTIVFPIQMLVSSFAQAIGFGAASIVSRRLGEKKYNDASDATGTAYTAVSICTLIVIILLFIFMRPVLIFFGATEKILPYAMEYLQIVGAGFFFFALSMTANGLVRAEGNSKASMNGMIIGAVLNCFLDPLFIFIFHWGVKGAAVATVISQIVSCIYLYSIYALKKNHIELTLKHFKVKKALLTESSILGIPVFINAAGMSVLSLLINNLLKYYGGDMAITGFGMVSRFNSLIILPIIGIIQGFQPIAGYNFGARDFKRVKKSLLVTITVAVFVAMFGYTFMVFFPRLSMSMFTTDKEVLSLSSHISRITALLMPLVAVQITGTTYFQAIGKPIPSLILGLSRQFIIITPLLLILPIFFELNGVWISFPLSDLLSTIITTTFLLISIKKINQIYEKNQKNTLEIEELA